MSSDTLGLSGFIDDTFESTTGTRTYKTGGSYVDGIWEEGTEVQVPHRVNLQVMDERGINFLEGGGQRVKDSRKVYVNNNLDNISEDDIWTFDGVDGTFKCTGLDYRPWRSTCRFYAVRLDV